MKAKLPSVFTTKDDVVSVQTGHPPMDIESDIRPISLTPNSSKVLESLISSWILAEVVDKFDDSQCNALKGCSTTHLTD